MKATVAAANSNNGAAAGAADAASAEISFDNLLVNVPLTPEKLNVSNEVIRTALLALGSAYINDIEDYPSAIAAYEDLRKRFPDFSGMADVLFNLYYGYTKVGDAAKAAEIKNLLQKNYPDSKQAAIANTGADPTVNKPAEEVTRVYEGIYDQFLSGDFESALAAKHKADSTYKTNYWSPQLLYIEAVYYVKQREDSVAKNTLNLIVQQNPNTPLADKASNMIQVLARRNQIEEELRNLTIVRPQEDTIVVEDFLPTPEAIKRDSTVVQKNNVVITGPGPRARTDSGFTKSVIPAPVISSYTYDADAKHYVMIVLNKVDNVFGNEAKNAFTRYNKERYYNLPLNSQVLPLDAENRLLLIGDFSNILQATEYTQKVIPLAAREIIPWLKADKYSFTIISEKNLEVLKTKLDLGNYKEFLEKNSGLKF